MAESNSQATRCPCGFFGSAQTLGLCSKCYNEREQNRAALLAVDASRSSSDCRLIDRESSAFQTDPASQRDDSCTSTNASSLCSPALSADSGASSCETNINPANRDGTGDPSTRPKLIQTARASEDEKGSSFPTDSTGSTQHTRKRKIDSIDGHIPTAEDSAHNEQGDSYEERGEGEDSCEEPKCKIIVFPEQKNMKRCFTCNCRLAPAAREIGKCKCECVFCSLHRLPEQHSCTYDHKEQGRAEARTKMIVLRKHVGTSLKRLDAEDV